MSWSAGELYCGQERLLMEEFDMPFGRGCRTRQRHAQRRAALF